MNNMGKANLGLLVTTRGFFNPILAKEGRRRMIEILHNLGHKVVVLEEAEAKYGCVETYEDAVVCANKFRAHRDEIDGIIVTAPNFGDEVSTATALRLADLNVPILVHAFDDDVNNLSLDNRRDSFCGKLSICANLHQLGIKFTNTSLHTCDVSSQEFSKDMDFFNSVCNIKKGLKNLRIAQFGTRPAAFQTVRFSEKILDRAGISIIPIDMAEVIGRANNIVDRRKIEDKVTEIRNYGKIPDHIPIENIEKSAKLCLVVEDFMEKNNCNAGAFECWDSIQNHYGCASCLPMSMMSQKGKGMACETDITGALSMYAMTCASGEPSGYLDWNNNYGEDREKCIMIHCGNYPRSFFGCDFEISNLDIMGAVVGANKCFGACKAVVSPGDITFMKITTDDCTGNIKAYIGEGKLTDDPVITKGAPAVAHIPNLQNLMDYICKNAFEHHVAMNRSLKADALKEAMENYLGWNLYRHR